MTVGPIQPLDLELSRPLADIPVGAGYRSARVLARWMGVPIGTLNVGIREGAVRKWELADRIVRTLAWPLARHSVRSALLTTGVPDNVRPLADYPHSATATLPSVTIAVCTRDRTTELISCLESLLRIDHPNCAVLVVDNAPSNAETEELVRSSYPKFRYVREERAGLNNARNRAILETRSEIIAFTDDDVIVDPLWARAAAEVFASDPTVGLVTGLVEPAELETEAQILFEQYGGFGRGYMPHFVRAPYGRPMPRNIAGAAKLGAGASMAFRRSIFEQIGLFDPALDAGTLTLNGGDHEIFFRVLKANYGCAYLPSMLSRHRHRRSMEELRHLLYAYGWGTRCFYERTTQQFPVDRASINSLARWWWVYWGAQRLALALWKPSTLPPGLVWAEIVGFWRGRGVYLKARRQLVADEAARVDAFAEQLPAQSRKPRTVGIVALDVAKPVTDLSEGKHFSVLHLEVHWRGKVIGSARLPSHYQTVSRQRIADVIAQQLGANLLRPGGSGDEGWSCFHADLVKQLCGEIPPPEPLLTEKYGVSIVVATCDRPEALRRCLQNLAALKTRRRVQVIVVDNRPGSGLTKKILREFPTAELVEEARGGSSYARNAGIRAAREEIVAMTDDDMVVAPEWLENLLAPFARPDVVAVTGNTLPASLETRAEQIFESYGGFGRGACVCEFDRAWLEQPWWRPPRTWAIGGTGNAAFRRKIFLDPNIGYFDEALGSGVPTGVGEDTKMFYDILHAGGVIIYQPAAYAWHYHRVNMKNLLRQLYTYNRGHIAYHLTTFIDHRDGRALARVFVTWPLSLLSRAWQRFRGRSTYPAVLLLWELGGALAGPWGLWRARRRVRRFARQERKRQMGAVSADQLAPNAETQVINT